MASGFGRDSFAGWVEETTYGTVVTPPTKFAELVAEDFRAIRTRSPRPVFRGLDVVESDLYDEKFGAEGSVTLEINYNDLLRLFEHSMGAVATAVLEATISWTHTFTLTDALMTGKGLSFYVNRGLDEYQSKGVKINQLQMTFDPTRNAQLVLSMVGQDQAGVSASTPSFANVARYVAGHQATMEIDDAARNFDSAEITLNNALDVDKRVLGSKSIIEPVRGDSRREITGRLRVDMDDADWDKFLAGTLFKLEILHTGPTLGANNFKFDVTALKCVLTTDPARLEGPGIVKADWEFRVLKPISGEMLTVEIVNDETTVA